MVSQKIVIKNASGLHARPAGVLAKEAGKCKSNVTMVVGDRTVTVKSILNIMVAGIKCGTEVEVRCDGENEEADLKTLVDLIESGLGE
ncbi:MAG: PTS beta-glucoside transporter subunit IIABC [Roseburia sp. CAG:197_41_10]|nr:MAG: PTS beta-glucoside transporter subunit IIABC [Roseburia sp. CAG:197_41_10]